MVNKKTRGSLKECSSLHPSPRGSFKELPCRLSPRGSLKEYSLRLNPRGSFKELTGKISPRGSKKESSSKKSPRGSLRVSPIRFSHFGSLKESSKKPSPQMAGIATSAMLVPLPLSWQLGGLSPLVSPILTAPITPPTPGSPVVPRIISTNWESLGCYDPYRYRRLRCRILHTQSKSTMDL